MSDRLEYSIGWICSISKELVAAQTFLDEMHECPSTIAAHASHYTLGKVGGCNVVIAVLPEYGSLLPVAQDMLDTFPNIRLWLLVGIAGGVPSPKHDIRLGDVVVGSEGVLQYDFEKTVQDQTCVRRGSLDQPSTELRMALGELKSKYQTKGHQLDQNISKHLKRWPRLRRNYSRPPPNNDKLYKSHIVHAGKGGESCSEACGDDISHLELRSERVNDGDSPMVHYGLIGSSHQLVKDAFTRDQLAEDGECYVLRRE